MKIARPRLPTKLYCLYIKSKKTQKFHLIKNIENSNNYK